MCKVRTSRGVMRLTASVSSCAAVHTAQWRYRSRLGPTASAICIVPLLLYTLLSGGIARDSGGPDDRILCAHLYGVTSTVY